MIDLDHAMSIHGDTCSYCSGGVECEFPAIVEELKRLRDEKLRIAWQLAAAERALESHNRTIIGDGAGGWKHDVCRCPHCTEWREASGR